LLWTPQVGTLVPFEEIQDHGKERNVDAVILERVERVHGNAEKVSNNADREHVRQSKCCEVAA
jgi:hypothetical protein